MPLFQQSILNKHIKALDKAKVSLSLTQNQNGKNIFWLNNRKRRTFCIKLSPQDRQIDEMMNDLYELMDEE